MRAKLALHRKLFVLSNGGVLIPTGLIVPFDDVSTNIPAGWEHWTLGANRAFRHNNTTAGTTGGISGIARTSAGSGTHTGTQAIYVGTNLTTAGTSTRHPDPYAAGDHSHSLTINYTPNNRYQVMMRATSDTDVFPVNAALLADSDVLVAEGFSDITPTGYLLYGASGTSSANNATSKSVSGVNTTGGHTHTSGVNAAPQPNTCYVHNTAGSFSHSGTATITDNIYRYHMSMWKRSDMARRCIPGVYGLWESSTPPSGWAICDGTNGTPNLTDYHIGMDRSIQGTKTGNGTVTNSTSLVNTGTSHHHNGSSTSAIDAYGRHSDGQLHSHTVSATASAWSPPYRTIIFIKCTG